MMETREFLERVLPSQGVYLVAVKGKGFSHHGFTNFDTMAEFIAQYKGAGDIYHACAAYKNMPSDEGARKKDNWLSAKSFWVDIDCGKDKAANGKGYETQKDAVHAIAEFCRKCGLPEPMVISSGYGIHCYWTFKSAISPEQWVLYAGKLKTILAQEGVLQDPSRTSDFSSILRPVGSTNKKHKTTPKVVKCLYKSEDVEHTVLFATLDKLVPSDPLAEKPDWLNGYAVDNSALINRQPEMTYDANAIADRCAQVKLVRDTKGNASYETWRRVIGILTFCENGEALAKEWTANRAATGHTQINWKHKFDTWDAPPPLCEGLRAENPKLCEGCPYKVNTPLVLGREFVEQAEFSPPAEEEQEFELPKTLSGEITLPPGYQWNANAGGLFKEEKKAKGSDYINFCKELFYPVARMRGTDKRTKFLIRLHTADGRTEEFDLPLSLAGKGGSQLVEELAAHEVAITGNKGADSAVTSYLRDQIEAMKHKVSITRSFTAFGWQDDGESFLVGDRLYEPGGVVTKVLLRGSAQARRDMYPDPIGTLEGYAKALNWVYNQPGMEPMQYAIASLWGAPLSCMIDPMYKGIPCALTGAESGKGKTTAFTAALFAFGDGSAGQTTITSKTGSTLNAKYALMGTVSNLPLLFDEFTNVSPKEMSDMAYSLANGSDKVRMQVKKNDGVTFAESATWNTQTGLTGNTNLIACLAEKGQSEAEAMRIFEIRVDNYNIPKLNPLEVSAKLEEMQQNMGCAGDAFIKYLVDNKEEVEQLLTETNRQVSQDTAIAREPKYRFYRYHMVCTITAAKIMKKLGVCAFNIDKLLKFAHKQVLGLCTEIMETNDFTPDEILSKYIAEHMSGTLITTKKIMGLTQQDPPRSNIVARAIKGDSSESWNNRYITSAAEFTSWCNKNRVEPKGLLASLTTTKVLLKQQQMSNLAMGTSLPPVKVRSHIFDISTLDTELGDADE